MPHISIKAETIFNIFGFPITNSYITSLIVIIITFFIVVYYNKQLTAQKKSGFFYILHFFINAIYNLFKSVVGSKIKLFFPILFSFFFYILLQNWFGLMPGVGSILIKPQEKASVIHIAESEIIHEQAISEEKHDPLLIPLFRANNADLNTTIGLALIAMILVQYYGILNLGLFVYLKKFFNFSNPINFFTGILEIISEFSKVISFAFRLFGNIFAGEVLLIIIAFLIPIIVPVPFFFLEIFVGFIQALVFSMLTAVFLQLATQKQH